MHPLSAASRIFSDHRQRFALLSRADLREKSHTHKMPARIRYDLHGSPITHPREQIQNTRCVPGCLFGHMPYQNARINTRYSIPHNAKIQPIVFIDGCNRITPTYTGGQQKEGQQQRSSNALRRIRNQPKKTTISRMHTAPEKLQPFSRSRPTGSMQRITLPIYRVGTEGTGPMLPDTIHAG